MKKLFVLLMVFMAFTLSGCKDKDTVNEEKRIAQFAAENSESLCKEHLKQKYDIDAELVSYMFEETYQMFYSEYTGTVACKMAGPSKEFYVLYDVDDTENIRDNYEEDAVVSDIIEYLQKECHLQEYKSINVKYNEKDTYSDFIQTAPVFVDGKKKEEEQWDFQNCLTSLYDGNVEEFFSNCSNIHLSASFEVESVADFEVESKALLDVDFVFISFYNHRSGSDDAYQNDVNFSLKEYLRIYKNNDGELTRDYTKLDIADLGDFEILYNSSYGALEDSIEILDSGAIEKEGYEVISPIFRGKGEGYIDGSIITKIKIKDADDVYVLKYYDREDLEEVSVSDYQDPELLYRDCNVVFLRERK